SSVLRLSRAESRSGGSARRKASLSRQAKLGDLSSERKPCRLHACLSLNVGDPTRSEEFRVCALSGSQKTFAEIAVTRPGHNRVPRDASDSAKPVHLDRIANTWGIGENSPFTSEARTAQRSGGVTVGALDAIRSRIDAPQDSLRRGSTYLEASGKPALPPRVVSKSRTLHVAAFAFDCPLHAGSMTNRRNERALPGRRGRPRLVPGEHPLPGSLSREDQLPGISEPRGGRRVRKGLGARARPESDGLNLRIRVRRAVRDGLPEQRGR